MKYYRLYSSNLSTLKAIQKLYSLHLQGPSAREATDNQLGKVGLHSFSVFQ